MADKNLRIIAIGIFRGRLIVVSTDPLVYTTPEKITSRGFVFEATTLSEKDAELVKQYCEELDDFEKEFIKR